LLLQQAEEEIEDGLFPEAIDTLTEIRSEFPYSSEAALAQVRLGDVHFQRGQHVDAVDAYEIFLKYYPGHAEAPYARKRMGDAHYEEMPGDWWFFPPSEEKEQGSARLAIAAYREVLRLHPAHSVAAEAALRLDECRARLARHELYVARFYAQRGEHQAVAWRTEGVLQSYPGLGLDAEALQLQANAYLAMKQMDKAKVALTALTERFADSDGGAWARAELQRTAHDP
jgi:outer membrane protein assembly factor BamD